VDLEEKGILHRDRSTYYSLTEKFKDSLDKTRKNNLMTRNQLKSLNLWKIKAHSISTSIYLSIFTNCILLSISGFRFLQQWLNDNQNVLYSRHTFFDWLRILILLLLFLQYFMNLLYPSKLIIILHLL